MGVRCAYATSHSTDSSNLNSLYMAFGQAPPSRLTGGALLRSACDASAISHIGPRLVPGPTRNARCAGCAGHISLNSFLYIPSSSRLVICHFLPGTPGTATVKPRRLSVSALRPPRARLGSRRSDLSPTRKAISRLRRSVPRENLSARASARWSLMQNPAGPSWPLLPTGPCFSHPSSSTHRGTIA